MAEIVNMATFKRTCRAEAVLYEWACGETTTRGAKARLRSLNFDVDFRQPDRGNVVEAIDLVTGAYVELEI